MLKSVALPGQLFLYLDMVVSIGENLNLLTTWRLCFLNKGLGQGAPV